MTIPAYQQRVIEEHAEVNFRLAKLNSFLASNAIDKIDDEDVLLLIKQSVAMGSYASILEGRISRFPRTEQQLVDEVQARR